VHNYAALAPPARLAQLARRIVSLGKLGRLGWPQ